MLTVAKGVVGNTLSWASTVAAIFWAQDAQLLMAAAASLFSIAVSITTIAVMVQTYRRGRK